MPKNVSNIQKIYTWDFVFDGKDAKLTILPSSTTLSTATTEVENYSAITELKYNREKEVYGIGYNLENLNITFDLNKTSEDLANILTDNIVETTFTKNAILPATSIMQFDYKLGNLITLEIDEGSGLEKRFVGCQVDTIGNFDGQFIDLRFEQIFSYLTKQVPTDQLINFTDFVDPADLIKENLVLYTYDDTNDLSFYSRTLTGDLVSMPTANLLFPRFASVDTINTILTEIIEEMIEAQFRAVSKNVVFQLPIQTKHKKIYGSSNTKGTSLSASEIYFLINIKAEVFGGGGTIIINGGLFFNWRDNYSSLFDVLNDMLQTELLTSSTTYEALGVETYILGSLNIYNKDSENITVDPNLITANFELGAEALQQVESIPNESIQSSLNKYLSTNANMNAESFVLNTNITTMFFGINEEDFEINEKETLRQHRYFYSVSNMLHYYDTSMDGVNNFWDVWSHGAVTKGIQSVYENPNYDLQNFPTLDSDSLVTSVDVDATIVTSESTILAQSVTGNNIIIADTLLALYGDTKTTTMEISTNIIDNLYDLIFNHNTKIVYDLENINQTRYSNLFSNYSTIHLSTELEVDFIKSSISFNTITKNL